MNWFHADGKNRGFSSEFTLLMLLYTFVTDMNLYIVTVLNKLGDMKYHQLCGQVKVFADISDGFLYCRVESHGDDSEMEKILPHSRMNIDSDIKRQS